MKRWSWLMAGLMAAGACPAEDSVPVPWAEFRQLYVQRLEQQLREDMQAQPRQAVPQLYSLDEASYELTLSDRRAAGRVLVTGKVVAGDREPIPLLRGPLAVTRVGQVRGGVLLQGGPEAGGVAFLPDGTNAFQVELAFLAPVEEEGRSRQVRLQVPRALGNALRLTLPEGARLIEAPGVADEAGVYHFAARTGLTVRYAPAGPAAAPRVEVDQLSLVRVEGRRIGVDTLFVPLQPLPDPVMLRAPGGARYAGSSLPPSRVSDLGDGRYRLRPPADGSAFGVQFVYDAAVSDGEASVGLPGIEGNTGRDGNAVLLDPEDGQVRAADEALRQTQRPVAELGAELVRFALGRSAYLHLPGEEALALTIRRFQAVRTPALVLDNVSFFTTFEENGGVLSVLIMDLPPPAGTRLSLPAVPDADIWSLKVNGRSRKVYTDRDGRWIVPLEGGAPSRVELAFVRQQAKLGLHGRLETVLPPTGLPAREVRVGIALPRRVQLLSLEGPVSPAAGRDWPYPETFEGEPYLFTRSFHGGEEMRLALVYKEPVEEK